MVVSNDSGSSKSAISGMRCVGVPVSSLISALEKFRGGFIESVEFVNGVREFKQNGSSYYVAQGVYEIEVDQEVERRLRLRVF